MTETNPTPEVPEVPERPVAEIQFRDRPLAVHMPTPEQLLVWQRVLRRLQEADPESWGASEVLTALERLRSILDSLLANPADIDWIDMEMLAGRLKFVELAPIVTKAVEVFNQKATEEGNREERRAAKKAVRKAPKKAVK